MVALDPATVSDTLGVLLKYQDDIARLDGSKVKALLDEVKSELRGGGVSMRHARMRERLPLRAEGRARRKHPLFRARACAPPALPVGPGAVLDALEAVSVARVGNRDDFYWTLHAVFVKRHEHTILFDQAFRIFLRKRGYIDKLIAVDAAGDAAAARRRRRRRARSASRRRCSPASTTSARKSAEVELDARLTVSDREVLQKKDFAQMTRGRDRRRQGGDRAAGAAARRGAHAPPRRRARAAS